MYNFKFFKLKIEKHPLESLPDKNFKIPLQILLSLSI
jgi:hypothetical protein